MKCLLQSPQRNRAQTLVFFTLAFGTILLLCGLAIDSGLLYLAKARLSRAVDGAVLAAVGNFSLGNDNVATTMRNFAVANYTDLSTISAAPSPVHGTYNATASTYTYTFSDGTQDTTSPFLYKRYVEVILKIGTGGQITSATCNARCPARTYFMGMAGGFFKDLKVSSSAVATRNPRLIMVVVDRSGSMLQSINGEDGGAYGLAAAIVTFLNFFDTTSDNIGIVSFSSNARLEMPLTTNFLYAGTNILYDTYQINTNNGATNGIPGVDTEEYTDPNYATTGVRRMKFGGSTAADEGMRLALEQMMANSSFNNPDVNKYIVLFTDGAWNNARSLLAAPGYTNVTMLPLSGIYTTNGLATDTVPSLSPYADMTNAIAEVNDGTFHYGHHLRDVWQSVDGMVSGAIYETDPLTASGPGSSATPAEGRPITVTNYPYTATNGGIPACSTNLNVWLQPGAVDYVYTNNNVGIPSAVYVSNLNHPTNTVNVTLNPGGSNVLVVPGYLVDGTFTDSLDLADPCDGNSYRNDAYMQPYMWPDDQNYPTNNAAYVDGGFNDGPYVVNSQMRNLLYRNFINILNGYYIYRADDPYGSGVDPLVKDYAAYSTGYPRPLHGLGPYYPSAGFYWPFDLVGTDSSPNWPLANATVDPSADNDGHARNISWSVNMLSTNAAPNWAGELFYGGTSGTNTMTGASNTSVSTQIKTISTWESGASSTPNGWLNTFITLGLNPSGTLLDDPTHYGSSSTNNINGEVLRPVTFIGNLIGNTNSNTVASLVTSFASRTGGYVQDDNGKVYRDSMAYSGRPTHYYDFSSSQWKAITDNHVGTITLGLGNWKTQEYAWHARAAGVTIYTVGYGHAVHDNQCVILAQVANATNVMLASGTSSNFLSSSYNTQQPIGEEFYATTTNEISNDFYTIGTAINAALTQ